MLFKSSSYYSFLASSGRQRSDLEIRRERSVVKKLASSTSDPKIQLRQGRRHISNSKKIKKQDRFLSLSPKQHSSTRKARTAKALQKQPKFSCFNKEQIQVSLVITCVVNLNFEIIQISPTPLNVSN